MNIGIFIFVAGLFLAYTNGANDNFKGVATLFGSGTSNYKRALIWATSTTFLGSLTALFLSEGLVASFSGKGLLPDAVVQEPVFIFSVAIGAALTVFFATVTGFPISTTHALVGGLVGAGLASGQNIHFQNLFLLYFLPLLFSPIASLFLTFLVYPIFHRVRKVCGVNEETCICLDGKEEAIEITPEGAAVLKSTGITLTIDQVQTCQKKYFGTILGISAQEVLNRFHYFSAGAVSFARGLNDTPKIVALLIGANLLGIQNTILWVGLMMALGSLFQARRVAQTMSKKITPMNHGQGFTANLISAVLVIFASVFALPVSTTHVTCGSIFGLGFCNNSAQWDLVRNIVFSWFLTLPMAAIFSGLLFTLL